MHERGAEQRSSVPTARGAVGQRRGGAVAFALLPPDEAPAAAVGNVAELLDVDVQHRARMGVFVATDRLTRPPVDVRQPVQPTADQHRVHRGRGQPELRGDRDRPEPLSPPQMHDLADQRRPGPRGLPVRPRRPVGHARRTELAVPIRPASGRRPGHVVPLSRSRDRPALIDDEAGQPQPGYRRQSSVSVHSEDLLVGEMGAFSSSTSRPEVLPDQDPSSRVVTRPRPTCLGSTARDAPRGMCARRRPSHDRRPPELSRAVGAAIPASALLPLRPWRCTL